MPKSVNPLSHYCCAAVAQADLPKFSKNGALYNQLLYMRADAAEKLTSILAEGNDDDGASCTDTEIQAHDV